MGLLLNTKSIDDVSEYDRDSLKQNCILRSIVQIFDN